MPKSFAVSIWRKALVGCNYFLPILATVLLATALPPCYPVEGLFAVF